ncbi:G-type lectin S-receptor-like serine/threonine-protein kinase SD2-5 [Cucumis melo var. makuwa]|uniref:G-type lectin S-receptor-like serine/threonine-protein kinase SD2-5 n=1 Tax=Cucumis melo var. makuwa TaxID=1194695 RepID=A0A5D3E5G5_CUCMM|nr:G-type lectin S-receptor-like serine/threonine-protein kinase SD2-5 [Cucumis melo var. makuwa]
MHLPPPPYVASEILLEADASTMENLFYEISKEKPGELPNGLNIVVKLLNDIINLHKKLNEEVEKQFVVEVGSISRIYHINLVRLYGFCYEHCSSSNIIALVIEYMQNGSLDKCLIEDSKTLSGESCLHDIAIGTARGLPYLHMDPMSHNMPITNGYRRGSPGYSTPEFTLTNYPITHV